MSKTLPVKPIMSEKAYGLSKASNVYVFNVAPNATKSSVAKAVSEQFDVKVEAVNLAVVKGKAKRTVYKRFRSVQGARSDYKKAYVQLAKESKIPVFAAIEEAEAKEQAAAAKAAAKEKK